MRCLGLDYGMKTCGVAVSDPTGLIASSLEVIRYETHEELLLRIEQIIKDKKVDLVVIGNPINLNGTMSIRSEKTLEFKKMLEDTFNTTVELQDERLSTIEAEKILIQNNTRRKDRKKVIDKMAAVIILQSYLDRTKKGI